MLSSILYTLLLASPQAHPSVDAYILAPSNSLQSISHSITTAAKRYKVSRSLLSCILKKESGYVVNVVSSTSDFGIGQINIKTARKYKLDIYKLLNNAPYAINKAALILSDYEQFNRDESRTWFCRYNIGYQSLSKPGVGAACERYLAKINLCLHGEVYL